MVKSHLAQAPDNQSENKTMLWGAGILSLAVIIWYNWYIYPWMLDDAFIAFRYAANFADGHGLVYNLGERVEGYTSFLWVFVLGLFKIVGIDIVFMSKVLGALFGLACIGALFISYRVFPGSTRRSAAISSLLLATCGAFTPWLGSGMEVTLHAFLTLLTLFLYVSAIRKDGSPRQLVTVGVLLALTVMTRPEGALLVLLIFADALFRSLRGRNWSFLYVAIPSAAIYVPYFVWRLSYYGYLLPNTFYTKVGSTYSQIVRGFDYVEGAVVPMLAILLPAVLALVLKWSWFRKPGRFLLPVFVAVHVAYVVIVGGDCMPAFRFLVPVVPLLALFAGIGVSAVSRRYLLPVLLTLILAGYGVYEMLNAPRITPHIRIDLVAYNGREVGLWLKDNVPPGTLVATNAAGALAYYSELPIVDMLGLNDVHIAHRKIANLGAGTAGHEKGDGAYVLSRNPDLIQFYSSAGSFEPEFLSDKELWAMPEFHQRYVARGFYVPALKGKVVFYVKRELVRGNRVGHKAR